MSPGGKLKQLMDSVPMRYLPIIIIEVILASALAVVLYWWDKRLAKNNAAATTNRTGAPAINRSQTAHRRRIPERTLLIVSLLGGWPGAWWASQKFRHKTYKRSFRIQFWIVVIANIAINAAIITLLIKRVGPNS